MLVLINYLLMHNSRSRMKSLSPYGYGHKLQSTLFQSQRLNSENPFLLKISSSKHQKNINFFKPHIAIPFLRLDSPPFISALLWLGPSVVPHDHTRTKDRSPHWRCRSFSFLTMQRYVPGLTHSFHSV